MNAWNTFFRPTVANAIKDDRLWRTTTAVTVTHLYTLTDLKHEHGQLLVVLPLLHGRFHISRSGW